MTTRSMPAASIALLAALCLSGCRIGKPKPPTDDESNGSSMSLDDFDLFTDPKARQGSSESTWTEKNGVIRCSGTPRGYIYTKEKHRNYLLSFEYRFEKPKDPADVAKLDTGCLIHIQGEHKLWPTCLEVQGKPLEMGEIKSNAPDIKVHMEKKAGEAKQVGRGPGEWNSITIQSLEGQLTVGINGKQQHRAKPSQLKEGRIGFQSEGSVVEFRNIQIRELQQAPSAASGKQQP